MPGLVIEAGVRDVAKLRKARFPVWSRAVSAQGTVKDTFGLISAPVVCAGQLIYPGDLVVADDDGVVVVPRGQAELRASEARKRKEADTRKRL